MHRLLLRPSYFVRFAFCIVLEINFTLRKHFFLNLYLQRKRKTHRRGDASATHDFFTPYTRVRRDSDLLKSSSMLLVDRRTGGGVLRWRHMPSGTIGSTEFTRKISSDKFAYRRRANFNVNSGLFLNRGDKKYRGEKVLFLLFRNIYSYERK